MTQLQEININVKYNLISKKKSNKNQMIKSIFRCQFVNTMQALVANYMVKPKLYNNNNIIIIIIIIIIITKNK